MENFPALFFVTLIVFVIFIIGLSIGLILKGKPIKRGTCGYDPTQKPSKDCEGKKKDCPLCSPASKADK